MSNPQRDTNSNTPKINASYAIIEELIYQMRMGHHALPIDTDIDIKDLNTAE